MLRSILNSALNRRTGGAAGTGMGRRPATAGGVGTGGTGRRTQDEAIGRGVRGLLRRFRV